MRIVAICSPSEAEETQQALEAASIAFERHDTFCEAGTDQIEYSVSDDDYERAAVLLESLDGQLNSDIDLSDLAACLRCGGPAGAWSIQDGPEWTLELYLCKCSGDSPVAFRDPVTKRGGVYDLPAL